MKEDIDFFKILFWIVSILLLVTGALGLIKGLKGKIPVKDFDEDMGRYVISIIIGVVILYVLIIST